MSIATQLKEYKTMENGTQVVVGDLVLINAEGGRVCIGDRLQDFRGNDCIVTGLGNPPHKAGSTGRIELDGCEYFPSVAGCEWVNFIEKGLVI